MVVYSLSPGAYEGLLKLADDSRWCRDYDRILRFLDVMVLEREAELTGPGPYKASVDRGNWKQVSFLNATERVSIIRGDRLPK